VPECRSCGVSTNFATAPTLNYVATGTTTATNILTCSGSATANVPGNVLQSGFTCAIGFFAYIPAGATSASGVVAGNYGCINCAIATYAAGPPITVTNTAAYVPPTADGSNS